MGGNSAAEEYPIQYFTAAGLAALLNYPLWRASAVGQSGFQVHPIRVGSHSLPSSLSAYIYACTPPYKGAMATVLGMTWARAAIFWGSDAGNDALRRLGFSPVTATVVPPLVVSTIVQCVNMPLVRATITIQDPNSTITTVSAAIRDIYHHHGVAGLWHGTNAGILKTVPKYITAVAVKDWMDEVLPKVDPMSGSYETDRLWRSAYKSSVAGIAGAALTNPLDVIRNEMFKTNLGLIDTVRHLYEMMGWKFVARGLVKNLVAVGIPVASTIFFTDALIQLTAKQERVF